MIEINLLPGGARKKSASAKSVDFAALVAGMSGKFGDKILIGSIAVMILSVSVGAWLYFKQDRDGRIALERFEKAKADSVRYAGVLDARFKLTAKRDTLLRQVNLIRAIDDDRYIWPHILDEVSRVLPPYTWITMMSFAGTPAGMVNVVASPPPPKPNPADTSKNKPKPTVPTTIPRDEVSFKMTGRTVDIQALTRFMEDLEASPFIGFVNMERTIPGSDPGAPGKELYQFQLTMNYSRPDSTVVRRLPLVTSGR
jgi:hypothetical protein